MTVHTRALFRIYIVNGFCVVYVYIQFSNGSSQKKFLARTATFYAVKSHSVGTSYQ